MWGDFGSIPSSKSVPVPIPDPSLLWRPRGRRVLAHFIHLNVFMSPYPSFPHPIFLCFFIFLPHFFYLLSHLLPNRPLSNNKRKQKNPLAVPSKCLPCICCLFIADSFKPQWQSIRNVVNPSFKSMPRKDLFSLLALFMIFAGASTVCLNSIGIYLFWINSQIKVEEFCSSS